MSIELARLRRGNTRLAELLGNASYEVMPFKSTAETVLAHVPTTVPLTVTTTQARGIEATLALTERLVRAGYRVSPHLAARQFVDDGQVAEVVARLREAGVRSVFVIGGDAPAPAGRFADAYSLLQALQGAFAEVGIGGYPEGHAVIPNDVAELALKQKAPLATRVMTQICFDARTTVDWAARIAALGITLPISVGMPGPVNRQKLIRISAGIGLGQSARFLSKQQGMLWRFLLPGGYNPTRLARQLGAEATRTANHIRGLHIFTFNEIAGTEAWRQRLLASLPAVEDRV